MFLASFLLILQHAFLMLDFIKKQQLYKDKDSVFNNGSSVMKKCFSSNIHGDQNKYRQNNVKKLTLKFLSFVLGFSAEETLNNIFCINLKAWCVIKFLTSMWYLRISLVRLFLRTKFSQCIANLGDFHPGVEYWDESSWSWSWSSWGEILCVTYP